MVRISNLELLSLLKENSRTPFVQLAKHLGVSETAIRKRVSRLLKDGVIRKFTIDIDMKKIGFDINAQIGIDTTPENYFSTIEKFKKMKDVTCLCSASGDHMIMLECWFKNSDELTKFVKKMEAIEGVKRICPAIILEKIK